MARVNTETPQSWSMCRGAGLVRSPMPAQPAPVARTDGITNPIQSGDANGEEIPAEVRAQGTSARRAWLRERLARRQEQEYDEHRQEARAVDVNRPLCEFCCLERSEDPSC